MDEFIKISTLVMAIASPWIAVRLSLNKFRSERLWERKVEAYERVIDAFYKSKKFSSKQLSGMYSDAEATEEEYSEQKKLSEEAMDGIGFASDVGTFLLSEYATNILERYNQDLNSIDNVSDGRWYLQEYLNITEKYMRDFIEEAKRDLSQ